MAKAYYDTITVAAKYRGEILNEAVFLEKELDHYIARHFVGSDQEKTFDFTMSILGNNRMSFESKKQVFQYLSKKYDKEWIDTYKSTRIVNDKNKKPKKEIVYHTLYSDLDHIIKERNILAHCILEVGRTAFEKEIDEVTFVRFRDEESKFEYNKEYFIQLKFLIELVSFFIMKL